MATICFITAIYGGYENSCKKFVKQTIDTDFICFTDNDNIINNGWIIDTTPYHFINKSTVDDDKFVNSLCNNKHTFNIAKYYKQSFLMVLPKTCVKFPNRFFHHLQHQHWLKLNARVKVPHRRQAQYLLRLRL